MSTVSSSSDYVGAPSTKLTHTLSDGMLSVEGENVSFVAEDFIEKIRIGNSNEMPNITHSPKNNSNVQLPVVDANVLDDLEKKSENLTNSVDAVLQEITKRLSKISAISVGNVQTCTDAVNDMSKQVEDAVHSMYSLIAHCEEMDKAMKPVTEIAAKIEKIKDVLSALEAHVQ
uniref:Uncharacterized protein C17orf59 homolog n=1 Tax=Phallusia mammillata TaxID=59560 RepID=A0A6F9D8A4_9ASCI|nr:uncharacterized protein C17orf59 homolog [Phallusia mammillata]